MGDNMAKASAATNKVSAFSAASMFDELALGPPRILTGAVKRSNDAKSAFQRLWTVPTGSKFPKRWWKDTNTSATLNAEITIIPS